MSDAIPSHDASERRAWLAAALAIALAYGPLTLELRWLIWDQMPILWRESVGKFSSRGIAELTFGLFLALSAPRSSGLGLGHPRKNWKLLAALMLLPPTTASIVIPLLPERPFSGLGMDTWLLSPIAQELVFTGFLYGQLARFGRPPRLVFVTALLFSLSHIWGFSNGGASVGYISFQLAYTFVGGLIHGWVRHLSGSVWYPVLIHITVNGLAVQ